MQQTVQLTSGVALPAAAYSSAMKDLADRQAAAAKEQRAEIGVKSGSWQSHGSGGGGPIWGNGSGHVRDSRTRDYESYLSTALSIPWVYQCLTTITGSYASAEYTITQGEDHEPIAPQSGGDQYAALRRLLKRPNPWMTGYHFREKLCSHYMLTGNAFVLLDRLNSFGVPGELHLLRPSYVRLIPDAANFLSGYEYTVNGLKKTYKPEQVIWFRKVNPRDEYWGLGVIEPGEKTFRRLQAIARTLESFFDSGARIKGVLQYDGALSTDQENALRESWRGMDEGQSGEYKTAVLQAGMSYQPIQSDLLANGTGMEALAKDARDEVLTLFGVPKQKIGIFEDANYRSVEADSFFIGETMLPIFRGTNDGWSQISERFNPEWEYRHHEKVVVDYYDKAITAHYMAQSAAFRRNEIREMSGQKKFDEGDPLGDEIIGPATMTIFDHGGPRLPGQPSTDPAPDQGYLDADDQDMSAADGDGDDDSPPPPASLTAPLAVAPGAKSLACGCPADMTRFDLRTATALDLGACPRHIRAVDHELKEGQRRHYKNSQILAGFAPESYRGVARAIAAL